MAQTVGRANHPIEVMPASGGPARLAFEIYEMYLPFAFGHALTEEGLEPPPSDQLFCT